MKYLRLLLFPFSLLYGLVVIIRNWLYDAGILKSSKFTIPIISVGNLDVGGAGKSPMTEYLVRLLKDDHKLATLSRGYGRQTKGFLEVGEIGARSRERGVKTKESRAKSREEGVETKELRAKSKESGVNTPVPGNTTTEPIPRNQEKGKLTGLPTARRALPTENLARQIGDEPAQFSRKFPEITVAVCEDRVSGIRKLITEHDLILLDDAYQHRAVEPGLSILLFDYNRVNDLHLLLPAGNMREPFSGRWRAQVIIVSKCPEVLSDDERIAIAKKIRPLTYQELFFTAITYMGLAHLDGKTADAVIDNDTHIYLLTGIANPAPLVQHLGRSTSYIVHHKYPDHHQFTLKNISKLAAEFSNSTAQKKLIITTEKDAQRLDEAWFTDGEPEGQRLPVFMLPIQVSFLNRGNARFDEIVKNYVREHTAHY